jgi:hypothetical protein
MSNDFLKRTKNQIDVYSAYPRGERARILNDFDASLEEGFGDSPREVAENLGLRARLEAREQLLRKAGR